MNSDAAQNDPGDTEKDPERLSPDAMKTVQKSIRNRFERFGSEGFKSAGTLNSPAMRALRHREDARAILEFLLELDCPGDRSDPGYPEKRLNEKRAALYGWQESIGREIRRHDQWSVHASEREHYKESMNAWMNFRDGAERVLENTQTGEGHPDRAAARVLNMDLFLRVAWPRIRAGREEFPEHYRAGLAGLNENGLVWLGWLCHGNDGVAIRDLHDELIAQHERSPEHSFILGRMRSISRVLLTEGRSEALVYLESLVRLAPQFREPELFLANLVFESFRSVSAKTDRADLSKLGGFFLEQGRKLMATAGSKANADAILRGLLPLLWTLDDKRLGVNDLGIRILLRDPRMKPFLADAFHFLMERKKIQLADILVPLLDPEDVLAVCLKNKTLQKKKNGSTLWNRKKLSDIAGSAASLPKAAGSGGRVL